MQWPEGKLAVVDMKEATPVAYINLYEQDDIWLKVKGCEDCPWESRIRCCGRCAFLMERGCAWHFERGDLTKSKPFVCVVRPTPESAKAFCRQEYLCIKGTKKNLIRRTRDKRGEFVDGPTEPRSR